MAKKDGAERNYWLMKSEPNVFSISDLEKAANKTTCWDGVRNYQARNYLRDQIKNGDLVFFYHSNADPPGIAGIAEVVKEAYPDHTAFDKKHEHYDPKSKKENPSWYMVDIKHLQTFKTAIALDQLKELKGLEKMALLQKGSRLSVQPVTREEWETIIKIAGKK
ncbi:MAG: EVE domain-containing protein [Candidatus Obscuribacterales bacterium]|nr:EVE domain-containing protein [Candidatus Obscuribacterales bacterium]